MKTAIAPSPAEAAALLRIPAMDDPEALRRMLRNARRQGSHIVERAVFKRLCEVQPSALPGTLEHDVWRSIHALEEMRGLSEQRTVRLSRTRLKIDRDGEAKTVADLTLRPEPSDGFHMLVDLDHPEFLFEAVALRHPDRLPTDVLDAARSRIVSSGLDPDALTPPQGA
jgi:hypothetical protein